jgi:hypothetical protein
MRHSVETSEISAESRGFRLFMNCPSLRLAVGLSPFKPKEYSGKPPRVSDGGDNVRLPVLTEYNTDAIISAGGFPRSQGGTRIGQPAGNQFAGTVDSLASAVLAQQGHPGSPPARWLVTPVLPIR